jgi:hypothetical protein
MISVIAAVSTPLPPFLCSDLILPSIRFPTTLNSSILLPELVLRVRDAMRCCG